MFFLLENFLAKNFPRVFDDKVITQSKERKAEATWDEKTTNLDSAGAHEGTRLESITSEMVNSMVVQHGTK